MRNFDYIKDLGLNDLYRYCSAAEENQESNPDVSAVNARRALEYIVRALYYMKNIDVAERTSLFELVDGEPFVTFVNDPPFDERLNVFNDYMLPLANYIDNIHTVIIPCG